MPHMRYHSLKNYASMKIYIGVLAFTLLFVSCGGSRGTEPSLPESFTETLLEKTTGQSVDIENISAETKARIRVKLDGSSFLTSQLPGMTVVQVLENTLVLQTAQEGKTSFGVTISGEHLFENSRPLRAKQNGMQEHPDSAPITYSNLIITKNENEPEVLALFEGEVELKEISKQRLVLHFEGKGLYQTGEEAYTEVVSGLSEANNTAETRPVSGTFTCKNPKYSFVGIKKEDVWR